MTKTTTETLSIRIDKWLWAARFFKTRSLASDEINKGRVQVNEYVAKPSKEIKIGDVLQIRNSECTRTLMVKALQMQRGSATVASLMYEETPASIEGRLLASAKRKIQNEPAHGFEHGRPTKRQRRSLDDLFQQNSD